jgi:hypothetical protein
VVVPPAARVCVLLTKGYVSVSVTRHVEGRRISVGFLNEYWVGRGLGGEKEMRLSPHTHLLFFCGACRGPDRPFLDAPHRGCRAEAVIFLG